MYWRFVRAARERRMTSSTRRQASFPTVLSSSTRYELRTASSAFTAHIQSSITRETVRKVFADVLNTHREMRAFINSIVLLAAAVTTSYGLRCDRTPDSVVSPRTRNDGRFVIEVSGNPDTYVPEEQYMIYLKSNSELQYQHKFKEFLLLVEHEPSEKTSSGLHSPAIGMLQLNSDMLTKFSEKCRNAVVQMNSLPKSEVQVIWTAPEAGSGCIAIRATVMESKELWFSDEGSLSKVLCEEVQDSEDNQPTVLRHCCACNEAKYEVTFEGLWSRNTHPKDFPSNGWLTRFSDIIGASHTVDYTFWNYGETASEGLRQLAENGNTRMLESELKTKSEHIRTIIKARGISYPNITGKTFAVFRVDNRHHLMSLVSMIDPSPDWIVGVSSLELCMRDCTWVENRVMNLYPWDAGTDDGPTYISPNKQSNPRDPIRRIKSNSPNDPRSPFYDPTGAEMKPLARLYLSRQRLYEKTCDLSQIENPEETDGNKNCELDEWSDWSPCSVTCGKGIKYKQRSYVNEESHKLCHEILTMRSPCEAMQRHCRNQQRHQENDSHCALTEWGDFSSCSVTCGVGVQTRSRRYRNRNAAKRCAAGKENPSLLEQTRECEEAPCRSGEVKEENEECRDREWSSWSPCSSSCGKGTKVRVRLSTSKTRRAIYRYNRQLVEEEEEEEEQYGEDEENETEDPCADDKEVVECLNDDNPICDESENQDTVTENSFGGIEPDSHTLDRTNEFISNNNIPDVIEEPTGPVTDCQISEWSKWSHCNVTCGKGYRTRHRVIKVHATNGGRKCPEKLLKKKKCRVNCHADAPERDPQLPTWGPSSPENIRVDCKMSKWSAWSPCSRSCGPNAVQQRTRSIIIPSSGRGKPCLNRTEVRPCALLACPE